MLKKLMCVVSLSMSLFIACSPASASDKRKMIDNMVDSVVIVEKSSGVAIYSEKDLALVLTAYHVIRAKDKINKAPEVHIISDMMTYTKKEYIVLDTLKDEPNDIALLVIFTPNEKISSSEISTNNLELGDSIWIVANPNLNYRTLKSGVISSKYGAVLNKNRTWEISGGVIFGSSGGGVFDENGKLVSIVDAVDLFKTEVLYKNGKKKEKLQIPITDFGFMISPNIVRGFLLNSKFNEFFEYLKERK